MSRAPLPKEQTQDILCLLALALLCYLEKILLGPYAVVDFYDAIEVHFTHFQTMFRLWSDSGPYSWYPFHSGGVPSFVGQHPPYHPAVFLTGLLPIWLMALAWNVGQMFLAGYGVYRFALYMPRSTRPVALLCATLASLLLISGNVHIVMPFAFPAVFVWTVDMFRSDSSPLLRLRNALFFLIVSLFSFPVLSLPHFPIVHLALVLLLGRHLPDYRRQIVGVFAVWTGYVLLYLPSIASLFLYIPYAQRDWGFLYPGFWPALVSLGKWFAGRLSDQPLIMGVALSLPLARKRPIGIGIALFLFLYFVAGIFTSDFKALFAGSFLLKMDLFFMSSAAGAVCVFLTAMALDEHASRDNGVTWQSVVPALALLPFLGAANKVIAHLCVLGALLLAIRLLRHSDSDRRPRYELIAAGLIVCLCGVGMLARQQFMLVGMFVPYAKGFSGHAALDDLARKGRELPFRVACVDVHPVVAQAHGLDTVGEKSPLFNKYFKEYVREVIRPQFKSPKDEAEFTDLWRQLYLTRTTADHDQRSFTLDPKRPRGADELNWGLLRAMNVTHVIAARPIQGMEAIASEAVLSPGLGTENPLLRSLGVAQFYDMPLWIYPLKDTVHRAYLAQPVVLDSRDAVLAGLGSARPGQLRDQVFVLRDDAPGLDPSKLDATDGNGAGEVRITRWSPDAIELEGFASAPAVLTVSNNFDPRWSAVVNGREQPVFRANHAFQGVSIDSAGPFRAELRFSSPLIWWLHMPAGVGVLLMFSAVLLRGRKPWAALAGITPEREHEPLGLAPGWGRTLLAGFGMSAVWALAFVFFVMRKAKGPQVETLPYALATIPVIGMFIAAWARALFRRF